jgi:hypothetical protein
LWKKEEGKRRKKGRRRVRSNEPSLHRRLHPPLPTERKCQDGLTYYYRFKVSAGLSLYQTQIG